MEEIERFFEVKYEQVYEQGLESLVDYLRGIQEYYENGKANESGVMCLDSMLNDKTINQQLYDSIKPAVENYMVPYELIKIKP
jgi:hypothetical protein